MLNPSDRASRTEFRIPVQSSSRWILVNLVILHLAVLFEPYNNKLQQTLSGWRQMAIDATLAYLLLIPLQLAFTWGDSTVQVMRNLLPSPLNNMMLGLAFASGAKGMVGQPTMLAALLNPRRLAIRTSLELLGLKQLRTKSIDSSRIDSANSPASFKLTRKIKFLYKDHRKEDHSHRS